LLFAGENAEKGGEEETAETEAHEDQSSVKVVDITAVISVTL